MEGELLEGVGGRNLFMSASRSFAVSSCPSRLAFLWKAVLSRSLSMVMYL